MFASHSISVSTWELKMIHYIDVHRRRGPRAPSLIMETSQCVRARRWRGNANPLFPHLPAWTAPPIAHTTRARSRTWNGGGLVKFERKDTNKVRGRANDGDERVDEVQGQLNIGAKSQDGEQTKHKSRASCDALLSHPECISSPSIRHVSLVLMFDRGS